MNYYPFHLGDYASHTAHLEPLEDLAYRRMIDAYYLREAPLPSDPAEVARLIRMRQNMTEVETVLREFFIASDDGWRNTRCDEEIERMQDKQSKARASAAASVNARRAKAKPTLNGGSADAERTLNERPTDVELPTPTPIPTPKETTPQSPPASEDANTAGGDSKPSDFVPSKASAICIALRSEGIGPANSSNPELLALIDKGADIETFVAAARASKGASSSFPYVLKVVRSQLQRAADIASSPGRITPQAEHETPYQRQARERIAEFAPGLAKKSPAVDPFTITEAGNVVALGSR